MVQIIAEG